MKQTFLTGYFVLAKRKDTKVWEVVACTTQATTSKNQAVKQFDEIAQFKDVLWRTSQDYSTSIAIPLIVSLPEGKTLANLCEDTRIGKLVYYPSDGSKNSEIIYYVLSKIFTV